jgi:hypothetical protein
MLPFALARFKVDATPPLGHPLCGGWIKPAEAIDGPLSFRGFALIGDGRPVVIAALDWTGVLNESHRIWTEVLADAAGTSRDRVALHCVHQHNAPFVDHRGNQLLLEAAHGPPLFDEQFVEALITRTATALRHSLQEALPVSEVGSGSARVAEVASNRRVLGPDGKVRLVRYSASRDPAAREAPVGTIDPDLTALGFYAPDGRPLVRLSAYATHPMSYYGDGRVNPDFVGMARDRRDAEEPDTLHVYFTGSAGNVAAGKYNDGSPPMRSTLTDRVHVAMVAADRTADVTRQPMGWSRWSTEPCSFRPRDDLDLDRLHALVRDPKTPLVERNRNSMAVAWLERLAMQRPIVLGRLDVPGASFVSLPAETFVEYQLEAREHIAERHLTVAAYGDGGPWYIPLERSFDEGGYEPTAAFVSRDTEPGYRAAIARLLAK